MVRCVTVRIRIRSWLWICVGLASATGTAADSLPGASMLKDFFAREVQSIAEAPVVVEGSDSWMAQRPERRRRLREMLGIDEQLPRDDLHAEIVGTIDREDLGVRVERIHFQSLPGLYVTANLYRPLAASGRLPAVLYLSGHAEVKIDGVSYGNKAHYQHHPTWFARNGYVSLVIDTLQRGEIQGHHHGTYRRGKWWWVARGYTPAGVEVWNSLRAIDYLVGRDDVDSSKIGVTGRSGGGIGTWWLGALDDRVSTMVPVSGLTDLRNHVVDGCIEFHCDCNYLVNLYRWDYDRVAALAAPKAILFGNSDKDRLFPLDGVYRLHQQLRKTYAALGQPERLGLLITEGPHADTQQLRVPAFRWMDRWLKDMSEKPVTQVAERFFSPQELRVFQEAPADERNTSIDEHFVPRAPEPAVPTDKESFDALRSEWRENLAKKTFRNSPDPALESQHLETSMVEHEGLRLKRIEFVSEEAFRLPLWVVAGTKESSLVVLNALDAQGYEAMLAELGGLFPNAFPTRPEDSSNSAARERGEQTGRLLRNQPWAFAYLVPRGIGPTRWTSDARQANHIRRRFVALGRTLEECWIHDIRRAIRILSADTDLKNARLWLQAERDMAVMAIYAGALEPRIERLDLWAPLASHMSGPVLMNVLKIFDVPQALTLVYPRRVILYNADREAFRWSEDVARLLAKDGRPPIAFRTVDTP